VVPSSWQLCCASDAYGHVQRLYEKTNGREEVFAAHEKRKVATLNGDANAVASMMIDDLTFTHANAVVETKEQFVDALRTRRLQYKHSPMRTGWSVYIAVQALFQEHAGYW
jgi:hypothetical protein